MNTTKLTAAQVQILDKLEDKDIRDLSAIGFSAQELGDYKNKALFCGVTTPSCRTNLQKLEKLGLVFGTKRGRSTLYLRTRTPRPESAEAAKARQAAEKEAQERRDGKIATCQGCLRPICLHDGQDDERRRMVRHGWAFISENGHYGWHDGECLGTAEKPLEDDYKVTLRCIGIICNEIDSVKESLATCLARPAFMSVEENEWNPETRRRETKYVAHPRDDADMNDASPSYLNKYERELRSRVSERRFRLRSLAGDLTAFSLAVSNRYDNKDTAAVFMKSDPMLTDTREASKTTGYAWVAEAA